MNRLKSNGYREVKVDEYGYSGRKSSLILENPSVAYFSPVHLNLQKACSLQHTMILIVSFLGELQLSHCFDTKSEIIVQWSCHTDFYEPIHLP